MKKYREQIRKSNQQPSKKKNIFDILLDIIYLIFIIPLLIITLMVVYQSIKYPDKVPDIFGYKLFIILDEKMEETLEYGDLIFTYNINVDELKVGNIVAFRNLANTVTVHRIEEITKTEEGSKVFMMKTQENEVFDTKSAKEEKIEGILTKRIPKIGLLIMILQEPLVMLLIIIIISVIGLIAYCIAAKLDERDIKKAENAQKLNN